MTPTTTAFEDRLLDALLERFDAEAHRPLPVRTPVHHRARVRRYVVPIGCLVAAAATASVVLEVGGSRSPARPLTAGVLAAWGAAPTSASAGQVSAGEAQCSGQLNQTGGPQPATIQKQGPPQNSGPWSPVLVDTRGDLTLALYSDGTNWMACLDGPSFVSLTSLDDTGESPLADGSASLDRLSARGASGAVYTVALGRCGSAVTGVGLDRSDGSVVTATVGDDRYIVWWPGTSGVSSLSVTTNNGSQSYPVDPRFASSEDPNNNVAHSFTPPADKP